LQSARETRTNLEPAAKQLAAEGAANARRAGEFLHAHEEQIRQAGIAGARFVAPRLAPPLLRPAVIAATNALAARGPASVPEAPRPAETIVEPPADPSRRDDKPPLIF
jgi:hypothetical protein